MIEAFGIAERETAVGLLAEGFPQHDVSFWHDVVTRIDRLGGNHGTGVPLGYFLRSDRKPVGIVLTPARMAPSIDATTPPRLRINLSSWYVRESERWRAVAMIYAVLKRHDAVFTDLTPTPDVARMLPALGFSRIAEANAVHLLPVAAIGRGMPATVSTVDATLPASLLADLEAHTRIGCISFQLTADKRTATLLLRPRTLRGLPAATIVHCSNKALLGAVFPAVARALLRHGLLALICDDHGIPGHTGVRLRRSGTKFARGALAAEFGPAAVAIDYAGTELGIIDF